MCNGKYKLLSSSWFQQVGECGSKANKFDVKQLNLKMYFSHCVDTQKGNALFLIMPGDL